MHLEKEGQLMISEMANQNQDDEGGMTQQGISKDTKSKTESRYQVYVTDHEIPLSFSVRLDFMMIFTSKMDW